MSTRGPWQRAKCWFELLKKCTKRGFKPESHGTPNVHANHLAMDDWLGRANARLWRCCYLFGRPTACTPSHFDCLCREGIQLARMNGVRGMVVLLFFYPEDASLNPAYGGRSVYPCMRKDDLWWMNSLTTDFDLVAQYNSGWSMLVVSVLQWTIWGGRMSGGPTMGGENNHTPYQGDHTYLYKMINTTLYVLVGKFW